MSRYIDADKIVITAERGISDDGLIFIPMIDVRRSIDATPTADVREVRHGEWLKSSPYNRFMNCSVCGFGQNHKNFPYCPVCGAEMSGKRRNENEG